MDHVLVRARKPHDGFVPGQEFLLRADLVERYVAEGIVEVVPAQPKKDTRLVWTKEWNGHKAGTVELWAEQDAAPLISAGVARRYEERPEGKKSSGHSLKDWFQALRAYPDNPIRL